MAGGACAPLDSGLRRNDGHGGGNTVVGREYGRGAGMTARGAARLRLREVGRGGAEVRRGERSRGGDGEAGVQFVLLGVEPAERD